MDRGSNGLHPSPRSTDFTVTDRKSGGLQWNAEVGNSQKTWENRPKTCFTQENSRQRSRESSTDSINSEQNRHRDFAPVLNIFIIGFTSLWVYFVFLRMSVFFESAKICKNSADLHISAKICKNPADLHRFAKIENLGGRAPMGSAVATSGLPWVVHTGSHFNK